MWQQLCPHKNNAVIYLTHFLLILFDQAIQTVQVKPTSNEYIYSLVIFFQIY